MKIISSPYFEKTLMNLPSLHLKAPGTCGELMQGAINEQDFLVNCPINLFSYAKSQKVELAGLHLQNEIRHTKIRDTIKLAEEELQLKVNHKLFIHSDIPRGKGMASSSADICAAFEVTLRQCGTSLLPESFAQIVTEIEPSDCVNFSKISHINHLTGRLFESLPVPKEMNILVIDCGGEIDTITFDRLYARNLYKKNQTFLQNTLKDLKCGLHKGDFSSIAKAATQSAKFNQKIHCKPQFDELLATTLKMGALGVNCAHSGTVLGVMYRRSEKFKDRLINTISQRFGASVNIIGNFQLIGGGCYEH